MGHIKVLLVGVCIYPVAGLPTLPICANDVQTVKNALISGLKVAENDIYICGKYGTVTQIDLLKGLTTVLATTTPDDTFIFYFSGHGGKNSFALSDGNLPLQTLIDIIEKTIAKSKIVILDSCHSGGFSISDTPALDLEETVNTFVGHGYAVLASSGADQTSGFNSERKLSIYTTFLVDALTSRFLIRNGKKSLEAINEAIFHYAKIWNNHHPSEAQQPIFRSNIGGTVFFEVEEFNPYRVAQVFEETDKYIIYEVEPVHTNIKRLSAKVILRYESTIEEVAAITHEIKDKIRYADVYQNGGMEIRHRGKAANIIWCYFGYSEEDIVGNNYIYYTTWVDDSQDKRHWYSKGNNSQIVDDIHIRTNTLYHAINKMLRETEIDKDELIQRTKEITTELINAAQQFIKFYREYQNNVINEEELIDAVEPLNSKIGQLYFQQSDLPCPPKELNEWASINAQLAGTIHDFTLYYSKKHVGKWTSENRIYLMNSSIKRYEADLEALRKLEETI